MRCFMSKLKLWCKGNYNKISLLFCLLFCLIAVLSKSAFLMCILVLCLALPIVVFVITLYNCVHLRQFKTYMIYLGDIALAISFVVHALLAVYYDHNYNCQWFRWSTVIICAFLFVGYMINLINSNSSYTK